MKKLLLLFGTLSSFSFLLYSNWPLASPERLLYEVVDLGAGVRPIAVNASGAVLLERSGLPTLRLPDGTMRDIRVPLSSPFRATALNDRGEVVAASVPNGEEKPRVFIVAEDGRTSSPPEFVQDDEGRSHRIVGAFSIANSGEIGVDLEGELGFTRGIWTGERLILAPPSRSIPKRTPEGTLLIRRQILFADGQVEEIPRNHQRRFTPTRAETFVLYATGLNDEGNLVGYAFSDEMEYRRGRSFAPSGPHPTRGDPPDRIGEGFPFARLERQILDLNLCIPPDSEWEIVWPSDINNRGEVVGVARRNGEEHGFLLSPLPDRDTGPL